jgi:hypothetical protein
MYSQEPSERLKVADLLLLEECPASGGPGSQMPRIQLDRWIVVYEAISEWYRTDDGDDVAVPEITDRIMGWMDPVQRQIAEELFAVYRQLMPKRQGEEVDFDPGFSEVFDEEVNASISVASQFRLKSASEVELVKLKTGNSPVSDAEKAVLIEGADDPSIRFLEVRLGVGEVDEIEMTPETRRAEIGRLFAIPGRVRELARRGTRPGLHCFRCSRPARCGQYPTLDGRRIGAETRTVMVSKTWLARLDQCERQVAWARLYNVPQDSDAEEDDGSRLAMGSVFHRAAAAALVSDDPDRIVADFTAALQPSERADLLMLWANHEQLVATEPHPVEVRDTEYGLGVTSVGSGIYIDSRDGEHPDSPIGVVFMGFTDAVGREADGTPAVIEHRTGASSSLPLEPELYALGTHLLTGKTPVTVHTHRLRGPDGPACERVVFGEAELAAAADQIQAAATRVAAWHPNDTLSAPYRVGDWCQWCPFATRCASHRS